MSAVSDEHSNADRSRAISLAAWVTASLSCVGACGIAHAQVRDKDSLEEVIVTAQKRSQRLQDVPISISVLSGADLDRSSLLGVTEALNRVPGVATTVAGQGGGTQVVIRGVTAGGPLFFGSSPIAYYLDSVPFGLVKTAIAPDSNVFDLDRVEVLRGPQGTLYGASAQNGVVRVLTKDADLDDFEFKVRTALSTTDGGSENYRGDVAVNVPLVEGKLAARAVLGYNDLSGWIDKPNKEDANDAQVRTARLKVNGQPTDNLSFGLSAWLSRSDFGAPSYAADGERLVSTLDESIETDYDAYGLKVVYDFPAFSVTSSTSYLDYSNDGSVDLLPLGLPNAPLGTALRSKVRSEELILSSSTEGAWRWSLGGMYRDAEDRLIQEFVFFPAPIDFSDTSESIALLGELTRVFMDGRFELSAGLRHFEDEVEQRENVRNTGIPTETLYRRSTDFDATSPRVVLTWLPSDRLTLYASYAEGFRSGFDQNANVPASLFPPLDPDNLMNYELGAKGVLADGRLSYDAAVYYMDWEDVQQTASVLFGALTVTALVNGKSASGVGFDLSVRTEAAEGLQLGLSFSWNDLTMDSAVLSPQGLFVFGAGERLNLSPEYTVGGSLNYTYPFGSSGLSGHLAASANFTTEQINRNFDPTFGTSTVEGDDMLIARTSFAIEGQDGRWAATLFADNLTNENDPPVRNVLTPQWSLRVRPRTIGLQLDYRF
jgi:iron complex outermembrane recepter protein